MVPGRTQSTGHLPGKWPKRWPAIMTPGRTGCRSPPGHRLDANQKLVPAPVSVMRRATIASRWPGHGPVTTSLLPRRGRACFSTARPASCSTLERCFDDLRWLDVNQSSVFIPPQVVCRSLGMPPNAPLGSKPHIPEVGGPLYSTWGRFSDWPESHWPEAALYLRHSL
jgi:hypothetical protein